MGYKERDLSQTSLYDRVSKLLESYEWSDCTFSVLGQRFKAHRLILGISSPVFKAMFYGPMSSSEDIVISDIEPDIFQLLINYIYTDKIEIICIEHAFELLYASKKYLLEYLSDKCMAYIEENLSVDNVVSVLNFSEYIQESSLISSSKKLFCEHADYLFNENLKNISYSCLFSILQSDAINTSENNLIVYVFKWTKLFHDLNDTTETCVIDEDLLKLLRFNALTVSELDEIFNNECNLLSQKQYEDIKLLLLNKNTLDLVLNSNTIGTMNLTTEPRSEIKVKLNMCHRSYLRSAAPIIIDSYNNEISVRIKSNKTVFIQSISVPTRMSSQINFHNAGAMNYSEEFTVTVKCEGDKDVQKCTNFVNNVEYDSNAIVEFSEPCVLKKDKWHELCFFWPCNHVYSHKYIVGHRDTETNQKVKFEFQDILPNGSGCAGSFLESFKFAL